MAARGNPTSVSDAGVGALMARLGRTRRHAQRKKKSTPPGSKTAALRKNSSEKRNASHARPKKLEKGAGDSTRENRLTNRLRRVHRYPAAGSKNRNTHDVKKNS